MNEVATYAVSSTLTIIIFVAVAIGVLKTISIIYSAYRLNKIKKIFKLYPDANVISFDAKGIPTIIKIKQKGETDKWMYL